MVRLPWILRLLMFLRISLVEGKSVKWAVDDFLKIETSRDLLNFRKWLIHRNLASSAGDLKQNQKLNIELAFLWTAQERALLYIIDRGLLGEPISNALRELETEMIENCRADIERFASKLPIYLMAVLACLAFPALMLLMIGPLLMDLMRFG